MIDLSILLIIAFAWLVWYYFNKFEQSEKAYYNLHQNHMMLYEQNKNLNQKVYDLEMYKNDVSKTFKILDNELLLINEQLRGNPSDNSLVRSLQQSFIPNNNLSFLNSIFGNINQESVSSASPIRITSRVVETQPIVSETLEPEIDLNQEQQQPILNPESENEPELLTRNELIPESEQQVSSPLDQLHQLQLDLKDELHELQNNRYSNFLI